jgi:hypothetical protein
MRVQTLERLPECDVEGRKRLHVGASLAFRTSLV